MILYFFVEAPHRWVILDRRNRVLEEGAAESLDHIPIRHRRLTRRIGVVPGELVTIHSLSIPARTRAKAAAAVPYMLEESLAGNVDELEFRLLRWSRGGTSKAAVMSRDRVEQWHRLLLDFPERVDGLIPEYLLLPRHTEGRVTIAADGNGRLIIRTGELDGLVINDAELDIWWQELPDPATQVAVNNSEHARHLIERGGMAVSEWRIGEHFGKWLQYGHQVPEDIDLLQYGPGGANAGSQAWVKAAAVMLGLAVTVRAGIDAYDYVTLNAEEERLEAAIESTLKQAFPDITRVVAPRAQMEQRLAALEGRLLGGGLLVLLAAVADAVPAARATVEEISFRDATLLITCRTTDFEALDRLQQRFNQDDRVAAELVSSGSTDNSVSGRFRINLRSG